MYKGFPVKNLIMMVLVAALLFSIAAGLSIYLNTPGKTTDTAEKDKKEKPDKPDAKTDKEKGEKDPKTKPDEIIPSATAKEQTAALQERQERLATREVRNAVVVADMRSVRDDVDKLNKQLAMELKQSMALISDLDKQREELDKTIKNSNKGAEDLKKKQLEFEENERKNIEKIATVLDSNPETAADILSKMADEGKLDTAAKLLSRMKDRSATKVLESIPDKALASQLVERMLKLKKAP